MKIGLRRLTASDLGWLKPLFDPTITKQKGFNADISTLRAMFPRFDHFARLHENSFTIPVHLHGPGGAALMRIERKLLKQAKNWRLDGEFIDPLPGEEDRFNALREMDYALIGFEGMDHPTAAHIYLFADNRIEDQSLLAELRLDFGNRFGNNRGFVQLTEEELQEVLERLGIAPSDPVYNLLQEQDLEEAALGNGEALLRLSQRRGVIRSLQQLEDARRRARETGALGEDLVGGHLFERADSGDLLSVRWSSNENATSPFDFEIETPAGFRKIDVKTTRGPFERPLHVSYGELVVMARGDTPYDIYRVYDATSQGALLRRAENVREWAAAVLQVVDPLFARGVVPDAFTVKPAGIQFGPPIRLISADEEEEGG